MLSGFDDRECRMNVGKTLFAQVMEFVPWKTLARIIERHKGDAGVRTFRRLATEEIRIRLAQRKGARPPIQRIVCPAYAQIG
jgi:hypothetical protein